VPLPGRAHFRDHHVEKLAVALEIWHPASPPDPS
jgi:hypothetical protein